MVKPSALNDKWLAQLDARVPRYTSYPTAPHFHKGVTAATVNSWLERTDLLEPLSLYLHIPFCSKLCWYCGCNTTITKTYAPVRPYLETLLDELELVVERLPGRGRLSHLHFGGGTPSLLSPEDFRRVMAAISKYFDFVDRAREVWVTACDENGKEYEIHANELLAVCIQHEIDHLNGTLFIDHISRLKRERVTKKFIKAARRESDD